ncbi:hypothetical protein AWC26_18600 [Mycobacterium shimoidei]|nr:hypothetical protein BHQ16_21875 [Mycobacterium shimoidei]ORW77946.1 hypothetical protein AWC26_18600 [Mycobacterium shimoidei]
MGVKVALITPVVLFEDRQHALDFGTRLIERSGVVVFQPDYTAERRYALVITRLAAEVAGDTSEAENVDDVSSRINDLRLRFFWSHRVRNSFTEIPYRATGLKRQGEYRGHEIYTRRTTDGGADPPQRVRESVQW